MGFLPFCSQVSAEEVEETVSGILSGRNNDYQNIQRDSIAAHLRSPQSADLQFVGIPANFAVSTAYNNSSKLSPGAPPGHNACYSIMFGTMYPMSRGSVHVQSADPLAPPQIDLGFLSHPADVDVLAAAAGFIDRVFQSDKVRNRILERVSPSPSVDLQNRDEARQFIREHIVTYHHALGTCSMGQVVDERLRVRGVQRLRVVDASVLPMQISAAIMATVYAIAEKASRHDQEG